MVNLLRERHNLISMQVFMIVLVSGILLGTAIYCSNQILGRGIWLSVLYGVFAASLPGIIYGIIMGNRTDEMGAIPYLVLAGLLIQVVLIPTMVGIVVLEHLRFKHGRSNSNR